MDDFFDSLSTLRDTIEIISKIKELPSNYMGCKRKILSHILDAINENGINFNSVLDAFSGSSIVSLMFKNMGKEVISNDLLVSSALSNFCICETNSFKISKSEMDFLTTNIPSDKNNYVKENYSELSQNPFFTLEECEFLDNYRRNVEILYGDYFFCGQKYISKNNSKSPIDNEKAKKASIALFLMQNHINQSCVVGGFCYKGQLISRCKERIAHSKNKGKKIFETQIESKKFTKIVNSGNAIGYTQDIIDLINNDLKDKTIDMIYLDPPYGGSNSDYANLYMFLEEYLFSEKISNLQHLNVAKDRYVKSKSYKDEFKDLITLCSKNIKYKYIIISYNDASWGTLEEIKQSITECGLTDIVVKEIKFNYQYRKKKKMTDINNYKTDYIDNGHELKNQGKEYIIIVR